MNGLRFPLWLICDAKAAIRLALATCMLSLQVRLHWPKHAVTPPTPEGVAQITVWLSCAEALLRWAITRQALRICGLDPRGARIFQLPEAASSFIWQARCRTFLRLIANMSLYARRWAKRIQATVATTPSGVPAQPLVAPSPRRFSDFFALVFVSPPAGQRIRAPPWRRSLEQSRPIPTRRPHPRDRDRMSEVRRSSSFTLNGSSSGKRSASRGSRFARRWNSQAIPTANQPGSPGCAASPLTRG